jgi:hypothetical protein
MSSVPMDINPEKFDILLKKLRLRMLTENEARDFLPLLEDELRGARRRDNTEYEKIVTGLIRIVKMYLAGQVNLYESNVDVLERLNVMKSSNIR